MGCHIRLLSPLVIVYHPLPTLHHHTIFSLLHTSNISLKECRKKINREALSFAFIYIFHHLHAVKIYLERRQLKGRVIWDALFPKLFFLMIKLHLSIYYLFSFRLYRSICWIWIQMFYDRLRGYTWSKADGYAHWRNIPSNFVSFPIYSLLLIREIRVISMQIL